MQKGAARTRARQQVRLLQGDSAGVVRVREDQRGPPLQLGGDERGPGHHQIGVRAQRRPGLHHLLGRRHHLRAGHQLHGRGACMSERSTRTAEGWVTISTPRPIKQRNLHLLCTGTLPAGCSRREQHLTLSTPHGKVKSGDGRVRLRMQCTWRLSRRRSA